MHNFCVTVSSLQNLDKNFRKNALVGLNSYNPIKSARSCNVIQIHSDRIKFSLLYKISSKILSILTYE
jgi:hypothetical protein